jgi:hypothetical protein
VFILTPPTPDAIVFQKSKREIIPPPIANLLSIARHNINFMMCMFISPDNSFLAKAPRRKEKIEI